MMGYRLALLRESARDVYFLATIPALRLIRSIAHPLATKMGAGESVDHALIRFSDFLVEPLTRHLNKSRVAMSSLENFWSAYDHSGLEIYADICGDTTWYRDKRILDFGCGVGRKARELAVGGAAEVLGVDISSRSIQVAKKLGDGIDNLSYLDADVTLLPERGYAGYFDYVVSYTVFEHLDDPSAILEALSALLASRGRLIVVFNFIDDKWGAHLGAFISHPWPQAVFPEEVLFDYWTQRLHAAHRQDKMHYFPEEYRHGAGEHNKDCFLNLNRWTVSDFESCIAEAGWEMVRRSMYSRSALLHLFPLLEKLPLGKLLTGSGVYLLAKNPGRP